jgi:NADPH:quinone reductase-like Zn-dependent oxidoreductase
MNRRVVYTRGGSPADVLTVIEEPEPAAPAHGQVLIRTTAFPVHRGDLLAVESYPGTAAGPVPVGVEATGVVEAIGPETRAAPGIEVGARAAVFPLPGGGPSGSWRTPRWTSPYLTSFRTRSPRRC